MSALRFVSLVVLALWVGGLAALGGLAAPTLFAFLAGADPAGGRNLAGAVFGRMVATAQPVVWALGATLLIMWGVRAALGPRPRWLALRVWAVVAMLGMSIVTAVVLAPRIDALRREVPGAVAELPAQDPRRVEFGRLHGLSTAFMLACIAGGLGLIWCETKDGERA